MTTRRSVTISLGATLATLAARAEQQPRPTQAAPPSFDELMRRPAVYSVPGMANVRVNEGKVYKTAEGSPLHFDLYPPSTPSRSSPAVILVHGTVPTLGVRRSGLFTSYGRMLAATGMIGIAFDHRLLGPERLRDSATDLADLVRHIRENASALGIDSNRLALWTFSRAASLLSTALRERPKWWKLLVAYYGVMEPLEPGYDPSLSAITALGRDASNAPPIVLARAGLDDPAINSTIDRFVAAANSAGATVDLFTHPTGHHAFDLLDPGQRSSDIIRSTLEVLRTST